MDGEANEAMRVAAKLPTTNNMWVPRYARVQWTVEKTGRCAKFLEKDHNLSPLLEPAKLHVQSDAAVKRAKAALCHSLPVSDTAIQT